jgi:hypothetical protein
MFTGNRCREGQLMDVKRLISELRFERQQIEMELLSLESSEWLDRRTVAYGLETSCADQQDSKERQEVEFYNLLEEFEDALLQQDGMMMEYCTAELKRLFRDRAGTAPRRMQAHFLAKHDN